MDRNGPSILIVRLSAIGDAVMTTAAVRALRRHRPDARISWVVESKSVGMLHGNPDIDELILWNRGSVLDFLKFARMLRRKRFDVAVDFQGLARSALITLASGARQRVGFSEGRELSRLAYNKFVDCPEHPHGLRCYLRLLQGVDVICDDSDGDMRVVVTREESGRAAEILRDAGIEPDQPFASLCPATTRPAKHWTESGWSRLVEILWQEFGLRSVFMGSKADQPLIERIMNGSGVPSVSVAGGTSLKEAAAVLEKSAVVVAVDTGLLHTAVALGSRVAGIYGSTDAYRNHLGRTNFALVHREMDCGPCRSKKITCERFDCMYYIEPETVAEGVRNVMAVHHGGLASEGAHSCLAD